MKMTYGSDTVTVTLGMPEQPILIDGQEFGRNNASGSCAVDACMRLAAAHCWGPVYETLADARASGFEPRAARVCIWDDVEYSTIEDVDNEDDAALAYDRDPSLENAELLAVAATRATRRGV